VGVVELPPQPVQGCHSGTLAQPSVANSLPTPEVGRLPPRMGFGSEHGRRRTQRPVAGFVRSGVCRPRHSRCPWAVVPLPMGRNALPQQLGWLSPQGSFRNTGLPRRQLHRLGRGLESVPMPETPLAPTPVRDVLLRQGEAFSKRGKRGFLAASAVLLGALVAIIFVRSVEGHSPNTGTTRGRGRLTPQWKSRGPAGVGLLEDRRLQN
jgi:hypothetical protein